MTLIEAAKIIQIMSTADGSCESCGRGLIEQFISVFPQFSTKDVGDWYEDNFRLDIKSTEELGVIETPAGWGIKD